MISPNVVILTAEELKAREDAAYQRGVRRGLFEANATQEKSKTRAQGFQP